jgi:hypothetical protein
MYATGLFRGGFGISEHFLQGAYQHRLRGLAFCKCEEIVDAKALGTTVGLTIRMNARANPAVLHVEARCISVENQVPPISCILQRAIGGKG